MLNVTMESAAMMKVMAPYKPNIAQQQKDVSTLNVIRWFNLETVNFVVALIVNTNKSVFIVSKSIVASLCLI